MPHVVYLGLGSNLGDRRGHIGDALRLLGDEAGVVERVSSLVETEPWGFQSPHAFLNACCRLRTDLPPHALLQATQQIERRLGRTRKTRDGAYHDRAIDIDILLYDDLALDDPDLTIPHPLMWQRDFVMRPLREIMEGDGS